MQATMYMRRCLELAAIAAQAGDTAVGALIVCGDEIVGEGVERTRAALDPSSHAEVDAIRQACRHLNTLDLRGCSLYSTVEPCVLCGYAIRRTGIAVVVYGVPAGQAGAWTSSYAILADRDLEGWPPIPEVTGAYSSTNASRRCGERRTWATGPRDVQGSESNRRSRGADASVAKSPRRDPS